VDELGHLAAFGGSVGAVLDRPAEPLDVRAQRL
jgi:hypothetical protein